MNNILDHPDQAFDYAKLYAASVASVIVYGHRAANLESFWCKDFYHLVEKVSVYLTPRF